MTEATIWEGGEVGPTGPQGDAGPAIELQVTATHIQWRVVGDVTWIDLLALVNLEGDIGATGPAGSSGTVGATGTASVILNGSGAPDDITDGVDGDWYVDATNGHFYGPKASGAWPVTYVDLIGSGVNATLTNYRITRQVLDWLGAVNLDIEQGNAAEVTLSGNVSGLTYSNWPAAGFFAKIDLFIEQGATPYVISGWGVDKWFGGSSPVLSTVNGDVDSIIIYTMDGGVTLHGAHIGTLS